MGKYLIEFETIYFPLQKMTEYFIKKHMKQYMQYDTLIKLFCFFSSLSYKWFRGPVLFWVFFSWKKSTYCTFIKLLWLASHTITEPPEKFELRAMTLRAPPALTAPAHPPEPPLTLPTAQDPLLAPRAVSPCPTDAAGVPGPAPASCGSGSETGFPAKALDLHWGQLCLQPCLLLFLAKSWPRLISLPAWDCRQVLSPSPAPACLGSAGLHPVRCLWVPLMPSSSSLVEQPCSCYSQALSSP